MPSCKSYGVTRILAGTPAGVFFVLLNRLSFSSPYTTQRHLQATDLVWRLRCSSIDLNRQYERRLQQGGAQTTAWVTPAVGDTILLRQQRSLISSCDQPKANKWPSQRSDIFDQPENDTSLFTVDGDDQTTTQLPLSIASVYSHP
ncbi:uncharacterized protein BT62DRAFT_769892 [Guyanagaster necrorhizus]|uniref:Uncharacterized protein n=1 Tax=Guyanagaster necrorhizus TaxID=856835 RepID=A0A9P7VE73_9AGAR|nr:uncharacterized protein BT62DRAFT_769892 [Guyanagaster necrorhizus MCA 3950]KAG7439273.1 hypothetical protein BT62DRAFT_769892 [Guyanagaster necrorhizus MCA 3950]